MRLSGWLIWAISWLVCSVPADAYTAPLTTDELGRALASLGVEIRGQLPVPQASCPAAVSTIRLH